MIAKAILFQGYGGSQSHTGPWCIMSGKMYTHRYIYTCYTHLYVYIYIYMRGHTYTHRSQANTLESFVVLLARPAGLQRLRVPAPGRGYDNRSKGLSEKT